MSAFRMYLRVVSESLRPEQISARLETGPDEATAIGSRRRPQSPPRAHTTWIRHASAGDGPGRPEDLEPVVLGWGPQFAAALGQLAASGDAEVSLVIVQELTDPEDPQQKGIWLSATLLAWLAKAGASLDIDQYAYYGDDQ
ncbi:MULTISPECIES: DUF4279 domain-containing protein [unclassified Streptomyces]|uniref:DUF4279 domain-containing protein n=1 Tax=unclassified Streptomyces TaxID=2593676 RepID=UPI000938FAB3|nr:MULTISPECIES: DUF4279 domain-containing protein [unclassified Streptomyces]OKJ84346.1 hypothetical protein AMK32_09840 [Streptomyces sp. CB01883]